MARKNIAIPQGGRIDVEYAEYFYEKLLDAMPKRAATRLQD